ncbi:hypothetical protein HOW07_14275 [Plantibacter sp. MCCC 1A11337]|uniref:hypothetical protein n=1 Tax=Plantibacter sp. MCCC 1A11337 TaxID=2736644 RepID=UPI0015814CC2|nr:hypothetical protein [Plantibacter sp. MCCC 1A11337]NUJ89176.1 hypothetical protein [Plantibacter sp. MCCC 1A11337]
MIHSDDGGSPGGLNAAALPGISASEMPLRSSPPFNDALPDKLVNGQLWHYTAARGALGILEHRSLRLGPVQMMNDEGELDYGLTLLGNRLQQRKPEIVARCPAVEAEVESIYRFARNGYVQHLYVGCASIEPESLSQIRGYGEYILGINAEVKLQLCVPEQNVDHDRTRPDPYFTRGVFVSEWRPVVYGDIKARELIDRVIDSVVAATCSDLEREQEFGRRSSLADAARMIAATQFVACAAFLKHPAFESEHEVRVLASVPIGSRVVALRPGKYGITPYVTVEAVSRERRDSLEEMSFINAVKLGPGDTDSTTALFGLERALEHLGYQLHPTLVAIPFRPR